MQQVNGHAAGTGGSAPAPALTSATNTGHFSQDHNSFVNSAAGFRKAVKAGSKARVALTGVSGSGKSFTMLMLARALAGPQGKIAAIDTEHGSLSKYAGEVTDFDVDEPESYTTDYLLDQLTYAEQHGYAVFCVDSLSHFWMGRDGALEYVDSVKRRSRDQMEGWKAFRPHERAMVDRFIASPCHIIVTMRVKTDYEEIFVDGKKKRVKVGLAPVQREGLEYEFDLVCAMDDENNLMVDKTRCSVYAQERMRTASKPTAEYFRPFVQWLDGPVLDRPQRRDPDPRGRNVDTGGHPYGTQAAADHVANRRIEQLKANKPPLSIPPELPSIKSADIKASFAKMREILGETLWSEEMATAGIRQPFDLGKVDKIKALYIRLYERAQAQQEAA